MPQIYLDMDGLLVDYEGGLKNTAKELGVSEDDGKAIWNKINSNPEEWWSNLKPIPEGMKIFNAVKDKEPSILSAAGTNERTKQGKLEWLKKNGLSPYLKEIIFVNKNYLNKKRLQENIIKEYTPDFFHTMKDFVNFASNELQLKDVPKVHVINSPNFTQQFKSFGGYQPMQNKIAIVIKGRGLADILRTLAHELVHAQQMQLNKLDVSSGETGSPVENEANALAGGLMRNYGQKNPMIFEL